MPSTVNTVQREIVPRASGLRMNLRSCFALGFLLRSRLKGSSPSRSRDACCRHMAAAVARTAVGRARVLPPWLPRSRLSPSLRARGGSGDSFAACEPKDAHSDTRLGPPPLAGVSAPNASRTRITHLDAGCLPTALLSSGSFVIGIRCTHSNGGGDRSSRYHRGTVTL